MNNFFYSSSDYDLFKKALRSTKNEPVVINILSDDESLRESTDAAVQSNMQRKQMSSKFQASPFDKFFGPRKKRTDPLDMKDFSSWRNKNYRESEKQINNEPEEAVKFSFSDYLNSRSKDKKYNSEDLLKSENKKSIDQLSSTDSDYKRFSLDSYLNKLEQQTKARKDFEETDDLVKDFVDENAMVNADVDQDENFMGRSDVGVEDIAFGGEIKGDKFAFDREELDSVRARLDKMEREANNIKDKPTTKVISTNELSDIAKEGEEDEEFNLDKLGFEDDIEKVNDKLDSINKNLQVTGDDETETPKVEHKRFIQINKTSDGSDTNSTSITTTATSETVEGKEIPGSAAETLVKHDSGSNIVDKSKTESQEESLAGVDMSGSSKVKKKEEVVRNTDGVVEPVAIAGAVANPEELKESDSKEVGDAGSFVDAVGFIDMDGNGEDSGSSDELSSESQINKKTDDYITKTDLRSVTDEIIGKFSEMTRGGENPNQTAYGVDEYGNPYGADPNYPYGSAYQQPPMDAGQVIDQQTGVVGVAAGSQMIDDSYKKKQDELQAQLMELIEQNKKTDEEVSKKLEMAEKEKLRVAEEYENRLRELETSMQEREEAVKQQAYIEKLKNDIKFKKSENKFRMREDQIRESEKSNSQALLDCEKLKSELRNSLSVSNLEMDKKLLECVNRLHKAEIVKHEQKVEELEQDLKEEVASRPSRAKATPRRRTTSTVRSRMRTRTPRRKIDSDIIGGINFD